MFQCITGGISIKVPWLLEVLHVSAAPIFFGMTFGGLESGPRDPKPEILQ